MIGLEETKFLYKSNFEDDPDPEAFKKQKPSIRRTTINSFTTRNEALRATLEAGEIPPGVTGLIPDGSTKVSWRWMGDVFEESSDDILQHSIVVRNLQELGVDSIEALKYLFPQKTDEERAAMLTGYPFRMVQQTQQSLNSIYWITRSALSATAPSDAQPTTCV